MTLYEIVDILKKIALDQPNIRSASDGSVYDKMNTNPSVQYDVFHISQTNHQEDFETDYYGLQLFYISRLEDSLEDNRLQIQSIGKEILGNVIRTFCENFAIDYPTITYIPFTQKFNDLTAGVYCNVRLEVPKDLVCADDYYAEVVPGSGLKLQDIGITITENGLRVITADAEYDGIGEVRIEVDVPQSAAVLQDKEVEYTENGSYSIHPDPAYDGLSSVSVDVDVPDRYDEGYDDGKQDGEEEQKAKLTVTSFTENNTYTRENGWSAVTVDVPQTGQTINNQTKSTTIYKKDVELVNGGWGTYIYRLKDNIPYVFTYDSGYTGLESAEVNLSINASDAIRQGRRIQLEQLSSTSFTQNGDYTRENGWSSITVNVPQGQGYEEGYEDGKQDGIDEQKAKLDVLYADENGTYIKEDGYYMIIVDVPHTGYTQQDLDDAYNRGYQDGLEACQQQPVTATSITLNVASSITDSGLATTTVNPSGADVNLSYSSSDTTKAVIDNDGNITVLDDGQVTFCVTDSISNLSDCKTVAVHLVNEEYLTFVITEGGVIKWKNDTTALTRTIEYKKNNGSWSSITSTTGGTSINVSAGDIVKFRGNNATYGSNKMEGCSFNGTTAKFYLEKNIMSLISKTNYRNIATVSSWAFYQLFKDCTGLTSAANLILPATSLGNYCYYSMFYGCTSLTTAPSLPATTLAYGCYVFMFAGCTSLTTAPALPATTLGGYCYGYMFRDCTKLTTPPSLPATSLQPYCYAHMFSGCTSLATAPALVATTLQNACYEEMFYGCTSLTTAPVLSAATLVDNCYRDMFNGCSKLNSIKCLATNISATYCTRKWVSGVASSGTFVKAASMSSWTRGEAGIPAGWTVTNNS